jgi:hypothetical protein
VSFSCHHVKVQTEAMIRIGTADVCAQPEAKNGRKPGTRPGEL